MDRYIALIDGEAGAYGVVFPDLPGCTAMGNTIEEALGNAADVLRVWVTMAEEKGNPIAPPRRIEGLRHDLEVVEALSEGARLVTIALMPASTPRPRGAS